MDLYKIGVKIFVANPQVVDIHDFVAVFHGWIQHQKIAGHLLIDVHDYSHVTNGPGILLVAHEGNFSMDQAEGQLGLFYYRKRPLEGGLEANLKTVTETALEACKLLESEPKLKGIKFKTDEILVVANDRLLAPNDAASRAKFEPVIGKVLGKAKLAPQAAADPRERLAFVVARAS
ncbi:MAG TPA: hypothetical protein VMV72_14215 [Verrucomicrobiae bacterium]|nr:hypothetical protein [Verrucomicrobiae bacterium]